MIPTHHKIELIKAGETDIWGDPTEGEMIQLDGNIRSQTQVVTNNWGKEVVSNYTILFVGVVDVRSEKDKLRFTEPNGEVVEKTPITVKFLRDLDGSVGFTKAVL